MTKTMKLTPYPLTLKVQLLFDEDKSMEFFSTHGCGETARCQQLLQICVTIACYKKSASEIFLTAVHEAVHVCQDMANLLGTDSFDPETQAYWTEHVVQRIVSFWQTSSKKHHRICQ